jgi:hypothetical protein
VSRRGYLVCGRGCCKVVRNFHETLAAELVARLDRVAACPADEGASHEYYSRRSRRSDCGSRRCSSGLYRCTAGSAELHVGGHGSTARRTDKSCRMYRGCRSNCMHGCRCRGRSGRSWNRCRWLHGNGRRSRGGSCRDFPGFCPAVPTELLIRGERCTAGAAAQGTRYRGRRGNSWRFFDE